MLRGARIDLEIARKTINELGPVYTSDAKEGTLSDEAIGAVNTFLRSLEGAMGKTADAVAQRFATPKKPGERVSPYFPLTTNPAKFPNLLEHNLPGVAASRPDIADAFERHQPYHPRRSTLQHLKQLYRENHHHDFTLQTMRGGTFMGISLGEGIRAGIETGDPQPDWQGINIGGAATEPYGPEGISISLEVWVDWYFKDPPVSVADTLVRLGNLCYEACEDVSATAGL